MTDVSVTPKTNAEFLARTSGVEDGVTAGPWHVEDAFGGIWVVDGGGGVPGGISAAVHPATKTMPGVVLANLQEEDAIWIAAARTDYPEALRRLGAAEAENDRLRKAIAFIAATGERKTLEAHEWQR